MARQAASSPLTPPFESHAARHGVDTSQAPATLVSMVRLPACVPRYGFVGGCIKMVGPWVDRHEGSAQERAERWVRTRVLRNAREPRAPWLSSVLGEVDRGSAGQVTRHWPSPHPSQGSIACVTLERRILNEGGQLVTALLAEAGHAGWSPMRATIINHIDRG